MPGMTSADCRKCDGQTVAFERYCRQCGFDRHQHRPEHLRGAEERPRRR